MLTVRECDDCTWAYSNGYTEEWGCLLFGKECKKCKKFDSDVGGLVYSSPTFLESAHKTFARIAAMCMIGIEVADVKKAAFDKLTEEKKAKVKKGGKK